MGEILIGYGGNRRGTWVNYLLNGKPCIRLVAPEYAPFDEQVDSGISHFSLDLFPFKLNLY